MTLYIHLNKSEYDLLYYTSMNYCNLIGHLKGFKSLITPVISPDRSSCTVLHQKHHWYIRMTFTNLNVIHMLG